MKDPEVSRDRPGILTTLVVLSLLFFFVLAYIVFDMVRSRGDSLERAEVLALTQVQLLAERLDGTLREVDNRLTAVSREAELAGDSAGEELEGILRYWFLFADHVANAAAYDAAGTRMALLRRSEPLPPEKIDPDEFGPYLVGKELALHPETLRLYHPLQGGGFLVAEMAKARIRRDLQMILGDTMTAAILDQAGRTVTGWGDHHDLAVEVLREQEETFEVLFSTNRANRVIAAGSLASRPLRVVLVMDSALVLGQWRSRVRHEITYILVGLGLLVAAFGIINRRNRQLWSMQARAVAAQERGRIVTVLRKIEREVLRDPTLERALREVEQHLRELYPIRGSRIEHESDAERVRISVYGGAARACSVTGGEGLVVAPFVIDEETRLRCIVEAEHVLPDDAVEVIQSALNGAIRVVRYSAAEKRRLAEAEQLARERENLVRETHHRVKNNLAVIQSLLSLEFQRAESAETRSLLSTIKGRIASISLIHSSLYRTESMTDLPFREYCTQLVTQVQQAYDLSENPAGVQVEMEELQLPVETVKRLGLILHELVGNAFKYARSAKEGGQTRVAVRFQRVNGSDTMELLVRDDGPGMPEDATAGRDGSIGYVLVNALVEELRGELTHWNDRGAHIRVRFPAVPR